MEHREDLTTMGAGELLSAMRGRQASPVEVVMAFLDRIKAVNPLVNGLVTECRDRALSEARGSARLLSEGLARPLEGLPFTVKDTIMTAGVRTTAGSRLFEDFVPDHDAPAVALLRNSGAILIGKTNVPELAMTYSTDNLLFGPTRNAVDLRLTSGGSSGGEASLIAAGGSPVGLGSDLGGSIRVPANFCGLTGFRPSIGRTPGGGHIPDLPWPLGAMSVMGPLARDVGDIDLIMSILDTSWETRDSDPSRRLCVGYYVQDDVVPVASEVKEAVRHAAGLLSQAVTVEEHSPPPGTPQLYELWDQLWAASGGPAQLLAAYPLRGLELSNDLAKLLGRPSAARDDEQLIAATLTLRQIRSDVLTSMEQFPFLISPVAAGPATERSGVWDIAGVRIRGALGFGYSYVWSMLGFPALAVPVRLERGARAGIQIVGRPGSDEVVVMLGRMLQGLQGGPSPPVSPGPGA